MNSHFKKSFMAAAALTCAVATFAVPASANPSENSMKPVDSTGVEAERDYIVAFKPGTDANEEAAAHRKNGMSVKRIYTDAFPGMVVSANAKQIEALKKNPNISVVEEDGIAYAVGTDTNATWGLDRVDQKGLPLDGQYTDNGDGSGVTAYILDTGIRASHAEFAGRVLPGYTAISDGNGTNDGNGHGTHVAGTVGGSKYGVAEKVSLVPVRVLGNDGSGTYSGIIAGIDWMIRNHVSQPAVANMSLGGGYSSTLNTAVQNAVNDGITVVVAAGNSNIDASQTSPASAPKAITVGATDRNDARASYSNFGSVLDIFAPGSGITSSWHTGDTALSTISGTSMASPHVAGAAAALLSREPGLNPDGVTSRLIGDAVTGVVSNAGTGSPNRLLHIPAASVAPAPAPAPTPVEPTVTAPEAPSNVVAKALKGAANITWAQGADGGSVITGQVVTTYLNGAKVGETAVSASATSAKISKLKGVYSFTVRAANAVGSSPESAASAAITVR